MSEGKKEILLGDCLELMKDIPNGSIDMILCDLPYGTTACKWDAIIPFDKLWEQYERIIKTNGAMVLFGGEPFSSALRMSNIKNYKYEWYWKKNLPSGFQLVNKQPQRCIENILIFYQKQCTYNKQLRKTIIDYRSVIHGNIDNYDKTSEHNLGNYFNNGKRRERKETKDLMVNPVNYLEIKCVPRRVGYLHPTQKPVELFEYLIKTYSNEGELILDNCAGSGTTAIACLNTNRQFIVMEKEQKYYDIILKRVDDFNKNFKPQTLFGSEM